MKWVWLFCCPKDPQSQAENTDLHPDMSINAGSTFVADSTVLKGSSNLRLEVLESTVLPTSTAVLITPQGLQDCHRQDGQMYVGSDKETADFAVERDAEQMDKRHFMLAYRGGNYVLRDLGSKSGTFMKVHRSFLLPAKCIVSFSDIYLDIEAVSSFIRLKVLSGEKKGEEFTFSSSLSPVLIGRTSTCSLVFHDSRLSRYQGSFVYQASTGWTLFDGLNTAKPSMNGTWVYVPGDVSVWDGLIFKAGSSLFQAKFV